MAAPSHNILVEWERDYSEGKFRLSQGINSLVCNPKLQVWGGAKGVLGREGGKELTLGEGERDVGEGKSK